MITEWRQPDLPGWLRELYPFRARALQCGEFRMSFVDEGPVKPAADLPVFVLLHGNPTWSFLFRDLIHRLRGTHRVIAADMIGFGLSDKPAAIGYHTLTQHIANVTELIEALDLREVVMVMNGWGGPIGLAYAIAHFENIGRLLLANSWAAKLPHSSVGPMPLGAKLAGSGALGGRLDSMMDLSVSSLLNASGSRLSGDARRAYEYPFRDGCSRAGVLALARMFFDPDSETSAKLEEIQAGLKTIAAPADIVWGSLDPWLSKLPAYLLRDDLKNSREPIWVENGAHLLPEDAPDAVAQAALRSGQSQREENAADNLFKILK